MNTVPTSRLVELNAHFDSKLKEINFAQRRADGAYGEEGSGMKTAAKVAGAGALAAGGLYLRGRAATGFKGPNPRSVGATMIGGANALKGDARRAVGAIGDLAAQGGAKLNAAGRNIKARALLATRAAKAKMPFGKK